MPDQLFLIPGCHICGSKTVRVILKNQHSEPDIDDDGNEITTTIVTDIPVCGGCAVKYKRCDHCDITFEIAQMTDDHHGMVLCDECLSEYSECTGCGRFLDDPLSIGRDYYCESCFDDFGRTCNDCGEIVHVDYTWTNPESGDEVCNDCSTNYHECTECGRWAHDESLYTTDEWGNDLLCYSCYREFEDRGRVIKDYDYRPHTFNVLTMRNERSPLLFGVELEVENLDGVIQEPASEVIEIVGDDCKLGYCKWDGSIDDGFEFVTQPCSLEYHMNKYPWRDILNSLRSNGCISHNSDCCGLHIHTDRTHLSQMDMIKLATFINTHIPFVERISRRTSNEYARFKNTANKRRLIDDYERYVALNFCNSSTVELRMMRGSLVYNTVIASIQFFEALIKWVRSVSIMQICRSDAPAIYTGTIIKHRKYYDELYKYMVRRNLIVHRTKDKRLRDEFYTNIERLNRSER